ncbi:MAG: rod shape-determining protein MreC [Clostridia bacterium]|nr:rod shape-determining protein MreC [Clostridia bacterium]
MERLFKNKFFIVCLCAALVICGASTAFALLGYKNLARDTINTLTLPGRWIVSAVTDSSRGFRKYFGSVKALREQNEALEQENQELKHSVESADLLQKENERLKAYLEVKNLHPDYKFVEAMVVGREAGNYQTVLTINRGSAQGIEIGMPVITEAGIVGCVTEVGLTYAKISTILETANSVGAYLERSGDAGILSGDYSMREEGLCKLSYLAEDADVEEGDLVLSSGMGSVYPADLVIGSVKTVTTDEYNRAKIAKVSPAVDFSSLRYLLVVTSYTLN